MTEVRADKALLTRDLTHRAVEKVLPAATDEERRAVATALAPWARKLAWILDEAIRIPGTDVTIGLDAILGFVLPGAGDVVTGTGSIALLFYALKERVPTVVLLRMVMNIGVDTLLGAVPGIGDAFDLFFRSNKRNLELIERHRRGEGAKPTTADYLVVGLGLTLAVASVVIPLVILYGLGIAGIRALWNAG